jgi:hypothetical protein
MSVLKSHSGFHLYGVNGDPETLVRTFNLQAKLELGNHLIKSGYITDELDVMRNFSRFGDMLRPSRSSDLSAPGYFLWAM